MPTCSACSTNSASSAGKTAHISSITFRSGLARADGTVEISPASKFGCEPRPIPNPGYKRDLFERKHAELGHDNPTSRHRVVACNLLPNTTFKDPTLRRQHQLFVINNPKPKNGCAGSGCPSHFRLSSAVDDLLKAMTENKS